MRAAWRITAKSISIKDAKRRSGDCARKVTELTPGDLLRVAVATENAARHPDRGAEVSRGRSVRWAAHESRGLKSPRRSDEGRCIQKRG
jgi:hypothetical protein